MAQFTLAHFQGDWRPAPYRVLCHVTPTKRNGLRDTMVTRVGDYRTIEDARDAIIADRKAMNNTFGGLISAVGESGRNYRVFRATWEPVE